MSKRKFHPVPGRHEVGRFTVQICPIPAFGGGTNPDFHEVMVSEDRGYRYGDVPWPVYVHLVNDPRFRLMEDLGGFARTVAPYELEEYNSYVHRKHLEMPTWRLSKSSVLWVAETCARLSKE